MHVVTRRQTVLSDFDRDSQTATEVDKSDVKSRSLKIFSVWRFSKSDDYSESNESF